MIHFEYGGASLPPSPVPPRLVKTPVAGHLLPQGGDGSYIYPGSLTRGL
jgi:hypothetical protein